MKRNLLLIGLLGMAMTAVAEDYSFPGLTLRVGGIYPFEKSTRRVTANMVGVGLDIPIGKGNAKGETFVSLDWFGKSASGAHGNMFPFMVNQRFNLNEKEDVGNRTFFFLGVGFVNIDVYSSKTVYGGRYGVGKEFGDHFVGEIVGTISPDANGARANTAGIYIGYRF